jgi:UDP-N-acetylglucosamine 1-carboxyvinyltransferase
VLCGLAAQGLTEVLRLYHLDRGYDRLVEKLRSVGALVGRFGDNAQVRPGMINQGRAQEAG